MSAIMFNTRYDPAKFRNAAQEAKEEENSLENRNKALEAEAPKGTYLKIGIAFGVILVAIYLFNRSLKKG
jgi:hypothetical protein